MEIKRTAWHIHPLGQTLIVTTGCSRAQRDGGRQHSLPVNLTTRAEGRGRDEALWAHGNSLGRALRGFIDRLLGAACALLKSRVLPSTAHGAPAGRDNGHPVAIAT